MTYLFKSIGLIVVILTISLSAQSQKTYPGKNYQIGVRYEHLRLLDRQVSPLYYKAQLVSLQTGFSNTDERKWFSWAFAVAPGALSARDYAERKVIREFPDENGNMDHETYTLSNAPLIRQQLNFSYMRALPISSRKTDWYAGAALDETFQISFTPTAVFFLQNMTLNPSIGVVYHLDDTQIFTARIATPLTGVVIRLPYANDPSDGKHGNFGSVYTMGTQWSNPSDFQQVTLDLAYSRLTTKKWNVSLHYLFHWTHYAPKRGYTAYGNQLSIYLTKKRLNK